MKGEEKVMIGQWISSGRIPILTLIIDETDLSIGNIKPSSFSFFFLFFQVHNRDTGELCKDEVNEM